MDTLDIIFTKRKKANHIVESNAVLKVKFKKLHSTVVCGVKNVVDIVDFLFQEDVLSDEVMDKVMENEDPERQCRSLLTALHRSKHPQAFVKLYLAIKEESDLQWLVDRIDTFADPALTSLLQEMHISEPTGFTMFFFIILLDTPFLLALTLSLVCCITCQCKSIFITVFVR